MIETNELREGDYVRITGPTERMRDVLSAYLWRVSLRPEIPFRCHVTGEGKEASVEWSKRTQATLVAYVSPGVPVIDHCGTRAQYTPHLAVWIPAACEPEFFITEMLPRKTVTEEEEAVRSGKRKPVQVKGATRDR
jgi:hypothetical protein